MTISAFFSIVTNSLRHLWRKRAFWIIQGLLAAGPVVVSSIVYLVDPNNPITLGMSVPGVGTLALNYLLLPFLVAPIFLDDFGKIGEIMWSGPLDNVVYFSGRFSGLWLGLAAGSLLQICGWFVASLLWLNFITEWVWLLSLGIYLLANFLGLSIVFLLAVLVRRYLPLMLAWAAAWVWIFYTVVFSEGLADDFYPINATAFINIFFHNLALSPSMGLGLSQSRIVGMAAWFFGVGLVAFSLAFLLSPLVDTRRSTRWGWVPPVLAVLALGAAVVGYGLNQHGIDMYAVQPSPQFVQIDAWEVLSQHTVVDVDADSGTISGTARFEFAPPAAELEGAQIVLRLNAGLDLTAARDGSGQALAAERVGDSVVISLPAIPESAFTLDLAWEGRLHIPYTAFEQPWLWPDAPGNYGFNYMPQPLKGLIQSNGGYLLRDGDWMPWPWTTLPHQARQNYLEIRPKGGEAAASVSMVDSAAVWKGSIPEGLIVFLPGKQTHMGTVTLAMSPLLGTQHEQRAAIFASDTNAVAALFGVSPPRFVVVLPYLSHVVWSGDLLLIPDGSGYHLRLGLYWLYEHDISGPKQQAISRAALTEVARAYLLDQLAPPALEFEAILKPLGQRQDLVDARQVSAEGWKAGGGRWVQAVEYQDAFTYYDPRWSLIIRPEGEWASVAIWMAIEMADENTRQDDLEVIQNLGGQTRSGEDRGERFEMVRQRILPELVHTEISQNIILELHAVAENIGAREALKLFGAIMQETRPETVSDLITLMEQRSQNLNSEVQP